MSRAKILPRTSGRKTIAAQRDNSVKIIFNNKDTVQTTFWSNRKSTKDEVHKSLEEDNMGELLKKKTSGHASKELAMRSTIKQHLSTIARKGHVIPNVDMSRGLSAFTSRMLDDDDNEHESTDEDYEPDLDFKPKKHVPKEFVMPSRHPSYSACQVPLDIKCKIRYSEACRRYEKQFQREVKNLITYQDTAREAAYLTRHMAYTTLWPPLHSKKEVERTSKLAHQKLTDKERRRLRYIMANDIR